MITPAQIAKGNAAFNSAFRLEGSSEYISIATISPGHLVPILQYICYLIHQSNKMKRKYKNKETDIITYLNTHHKADYSLAVLIQTVGLHDMYEAYPACCRMIRQFLATDEL